MSTLLKAFSKEELIEKFKEIYAKGWIKNYRGRNDGAVGNILEDLLEIPENNLPIPNASEWELKAQRSNTSSLLTMFHMEPSPRALKVVPTILLQKYGWLSAEAGGKYPEDEMSFRATLNAKSFSDRGFKVNVNDKEKRIDIIFDCTHADERHCQWLKNVQNKVGHLNNFDVAPYWGFDDLFHKAGVKLINCFYVQAEEKWEVESGKRQNFFLYNYVLKLSQFDQTKFIEAIRQGKIYVDFDARTGHNHGTKFRLRYSDIPFLYKNAEVVLDERASQ
ncbi:MAG: MvaI/BcnI restriction endonuclease family protein [Bacteroidaceae bacterium]|nr:MvaI/BcnI restriction endonuclease family protein [Bacteroidaceae bacterium]